MNLPGPFLRVTLLDCGFYWPMRSPATHFGLAAIASDPPSHRSYQRLRPSKRAGDHRKPPKPDANHPKSVKGQPRIASPLPRNPRTLCNLLDALARQTILSAEGIRSHGAFTQAPDDSCITVSKPPSAAGLF
jgi:hypothetical protein